MNEKRIDAIEARCKLSQKSQSAKLLERILTIQCANRTQLTQIMKDLDTLTVNLTELYEKTESIDNFIHGYILALGAELGNHREGFYWMYKALDLPYDDIKGWDINNEKEEPPQPNRRSLNSICQAFLRKIKTKLNRGTPNVNH